MGDLLGLLEATAIARDLRASVWVYPLLNAVHLLGVGLLFGAIAALDLRLLGLWRRQPLVPLWQVLSATAASGIAIAVASGGLHFAVRATEYAQSPFFLAKIAVFAVGCLNALGLRRIAGRAGWPMSGAAPPAGVRVFAAVSLVAWTAAIVLGRLIGYF